MELAIREQRLLLVGLCQQGLIQVGLVIQQLSKYRSKQMLLLVAKVEMYFEVFKRINLELKELEWTEQVLELAV